MIHGEAEDFRGDPSGKLILAHTARRLTEKERTIGSGAPFGTVDVLIKETSDVFRRRAFEFLRDYFPDVPMHRIRHLMNCQIVVCNPEVLLIRNGQAVENVYLVLSGTVEMLRPGVAGASQPAGLLIRRLGAARQQCPKPPRGESWRCGSLSTCTDRDAQHALPADRPVRDKGRIAAHGCSRRVLRHAQPAGECRGAPVSRRTSGLPEREVDSAPDRRSIATSSHVER